MLVLYRMSAVPSFLVGPVVTVVDCLFDLYRMSGVPSFLTGAFEVVVVDIFDDLSTFVVVDLVVFGVWANIPLPAMRKRKAINNFFTVFFLGFILSRFRLYKITTVSKSAGNNIVNNW